MGKKESFFSGMRDGIPIALGYFAVSFSFGILAVSGGLSPWEAGLISLTNLTSAGQFAGLEVIVAGGTYLELMLTQVVINLRYLLMSFSLSQKLRMDEPHFHRLILAFGITDEIFGISIGQKDKVSAFYHYGAMCVAIPGWTLGTVVGAIFGNILPVIVVNALSVALYGMFIAIVIPPAKQDKNVLSAVVVAMIAGLVFSVVPYLRDISSGFSIIIITVSISAVMAFVAPLGKNREGDNAA